MSCRPQEDTGHQASLPCYDHQESEEVFHLWGPGRALNSHRCRPGSKFWWYKTSQVDIYCPIIKLFRFWTIKTFAGGFGRVTTKARREWSRLSAPCRWGWTTAGTRFSSTCRTSPGGPMEPITSRRCVYRLVHGDRSGTSYNSWLYSLMSDLLFWFFPPPSDPRQLSNKESVLLRQTVLWGWAPSRV